MRFFFKIQCIFKAFVQNPCILMLHLCNKEHLGPSGKWDLLAIGTFSIGTLGQLRPLGNWGIGTFGELGPSDN